MATILERQPGVFFAPVWLPPTSDGQKGRQVGKVFRGGTAPSSVGATVADLLRLWQEAKQFDWQPTSARDYAGRCRAITAAIGSVRLVDLDPFRVDAWVAETRKAGVGEGAIRSRVSALRSAISWGISRRMMRSNPVSEAKPKVQQPPHQATRAGAGRRAHRCRGPGGRPSRARSSPRGRHRRAGGRDRRAPVRRPRRRSAARRSAAPLGRT